MMRMLHRLRKSEDGSATIELAIVASTLALMLVGVVDITTAFNRKLEMEQALQRSLEKIMNTTTNTTPALTIKTEVSSAVSGVQDSDITVDYLLECNDVIQPQAAAAPSTTEPDEEPDASAGCGPTEVQRRYITASVSTEYVPIFSLDKLGMERTVFHITAKAGMRLE